MPALPIVWPHNDGHYPWSDGAPRSFKEWQPIWPNRLKYRRSRFAHPLRARQSLVRFIALRNVAENEMKFSRGDLIAAVYEARTRGGSSAAKQQQYSANRRHGYTNAIRMNFVKA
jgi:hypothetical protein